VQTKVKSYLAKKNQENHRRVVPPNPEAVRVPELPELDDDRLEDFGELLKKDKF